MGKEKVRVFEVGPRDGFQNEPLSIKAETKLWFIQRLAEAGLQDIEIGSFVRPDRVPQMAGTDFLASSIQNRQLKMRKAKAWCLVPNLHGLERAIQSGITRIAVFTAATERFNQKNIGMSVSESLKVIRTVIEQARKELGSKLRVRGYVSTAFGCPFEGKVKPLKALKVIEKIAAMNVNEISIGDTIGVASPKDVQDLVGPAFKLLGVNGTAVHFHDTRGTALANALRSLDLGVRTIDSSAGGFGGCPFAPGAAGNLATEDLVYMLNRMGMHSGIDIERLSKTTLNLCHQIKRPLTSRYLQAYASQCKL